MGYSVAILGATGAVGEEFIRLLDERNFAADSLRLLASARSKGRKLSFKGADITVEELGHHSFEGVDLVLSSASATISSEYVPLAIKAGAVVVDNTACYRMDPKAPLVVPEVNPEKIQDHEGVIANPNCSTIIMALPLYPLHRAFGVKRVYVATYQAASGAGRRAMEELEQESRAVLDGRDFTRTVIPHRYAFNLFIHNSDLLADEYAGYVKEEWKMIVETRKIFDEPNFRVNAMCVRVPVLRAHSEALNIEFERDVSPEQAYAVLEEAPGVQILEDRAANRWPMPIDASGKDPVYVGRIRRDVSQPNTLDLWVVGDQIRKGAALNAVQIAERL